MFDAHIFSTPLLTLLSPNPSTAHLVLFVDEYAVEVEVDVPARLPADADNDVIPVRDAERIARIQHRRGGLQIWKGEVVWCVCMY